MDMSNFASFQMLAVQTPGLWQSQLASLAAKMNTEQSNDSSAGMDAISLQKALLQQQQAFQLQLQNILMLQQSGLNSALNLSNSNPLISMELNKQQLKAAASRSPSPAALKEEVEENKMMQVNNRLENENNQHFVRALGNNLIYCNSC